MAFERFPYTNFHDLNLDWILEQVKQWAAEWADVKAAYEAFDHDLSDIISEINAINIQLDGVDSNINDIYNQLSGVRSSIREISESMQSYEDYANALIQDLEDRVSAIEEYAVYKMYSPFTGELVPITEIITELAYLHLVDALTALEYDTLEMTAQAHDLKELTAIQYDSSGKSLLP